MNAWRLKPIYDAEDLIAEGWFVFERVKANYPLVQNDTDFIRLFVKAFFNQIVNLCRKHMQQVDAPICIDDEITNAPTRVSASDLLACINEAPSYLRDGLRELVQVVVEGRPNSSAYSDSETLCKIIKDDERKKRLALCKQDCLSEEVCVPEKHLYHRSLLEWIEDSLHA